MEDPERYGLAQHARRPGGKTRAESERSITPDAEVLHRSAERRDEKVIFGAESVLDLRDRGQDKAGEARHDTTGRRDDLRPQAFRSRLADIFRFDSVGGARDAHLDALGAAGAA